MKPKYVCCSYRAKEDSNYPADATIAARAFITRNYTISTSTAQVANVISDGSVVSVSSKPSMKQEHGIGVQCDGPNLVVSLVKYLL